MDARIASPARVTPRDAGTLLLLDTSGQQPRVLMGRRHARLAFMANLFVFPGGRVDPQDALLRGISDLPPPDHLRAALGASRRRARAMALAALRETFEEAGLAIGEPGTFEPSGESWTAFAAHGLRPDLSALRLVARAITPPGAPRRFDTRFFAIVGDQGFSASRRAQPSGELGELCWPTLDEALQLPIPDITRLILEHLVARLRADPGLQPGGPALFFRQSRGKRLNTLL
ncbi:MAG: NUDIX hydrolase [Methylobacterium mesophilicum]|nr:NUDIX hydrolase [Methylobacterium mesophilicum]